MPLRAPASASVSQPVAASPFRHLLVASLRQFQRLFPDDATCAAHLERSRWSGKSVCPRCGVVGGPYCIAMRPGVLTRRACRRQTELTVGTVMERSRTLLSTWFWAA